MSRILEVIKRIKPSISDLSANESLFMSGHLDSYDMVLLISELENEFGVVIPGEKMLPEFLDSAESISKLMEDLKATAK